MKVATLEALKKELKLPLNALCTVLSSDFSERRGVLALLKEHYQLSVSSCSAVSATTESLKALFFEPSLFGSKGLIHLEGLEELGSSERKWLEESLKEKRLEGPVLFSGSALSANTSLYKRLAEETLFLEYSSKEKPKERKARFLQEIERYSKERGITIPSDVSKRLIEEGPQELSSLFMELEKLETYIFPRKKIALEDLEEVVSLSSQGTLWQLADLLLQREARALTLGSELFSKGEELIPLVRGLRVKFEKSARVASLLAHGEDVQGEYPYLRGYALEQELQRIQKMGLPRLKKALLALDEVEWAAKNGPSNPELLFQKLLCEIIC